MKKVLCMLMILVSSFGLSPTATAQTAHAVQNVSQLSFNEGILSLCWVQDTLYVLGNETIYQWHSGATSSEIYWECPGLQNYRYQNVAPESETDRALWEQAVSFLLPGKDALYALQPYTGQIFEVTSQNLIPVACLPQSSFTYQQGDQTMNRDIRTVVMQDNTLFLLLGTDDPNDWKKTSLISFDLQTQQDKEYDIPNIQHFVAMPDEQLMLILNEPENGKLTYQTLDTVSGETVIAFAGLTDDAAAGSSAFWQGQLLNCTAGQITAYAEDGTSQAKAYVPVPAYNSSKIACNSESLCAVLYGSYVFLRDITQPTTQTVLHVMGDIDPNMLFAFSLQNPDIAVVTLAQLTGDALQQAVLSAGSNIDLFVVTAPGLYTQMKEKGYLASLNGAEKAKDKLGMFYPCIQEVLLQEDQMVAYPISMSTESWTLNQTLWDRFSLGNIPTTYTDLLDMMQLWQEDYSEDNPDYRLIDLPGDVASCVKLLTKEYILHCGSEYPDFKSPDFRNAMLSLIKHQDTIIDNGAQYGMPLIYTYFQGFGIGYNDDEKTQMMLMPAIVEGEEQKLSGTLTLLAMSSSCTQQEAALRFVTYFSENTDAITEYMLMSSLNNPLRRENYSERMAVLAEEKADIEKMIMSATDENVAEFKERLTQKEYEIASAEEDWLVSAESISNYRAIAANLVIPYEVPFFSGNTGFAAMEAVIDTACGQTLTEERLNNLLEDLNRVSRMVMLEDN